MVPHAEGATAPQDDAMTRRFVHFACLDWSGAATAPLKGIALAVCDVAPAAPILQTPPHGPYWSREDVLGWLLDRADARDDMLIGIDFSPSLPFADTGAFFPGWAISPPDAPSLWAMVDDLCRTDPDLGANGFLTEDRAGLWFHRHRIPIDRNRFGEDGRGRLRVVERVARALGVTPASCFKLVGANQVGKSSLTGMRLLHRLRGRVPIWPFDPVPAHGPVIVEIYTSIAALEGGRRPGHTKMRTIAEMNEALITLGSRTISGSGPIDDHRSDAVVTAAWLRGVAQQHALWHPAELEQQPALRHTEGWTFGVP